MTTPKGYVLGRFTSPIDGETCVAIMTMKSKNRKTGDMAQVYILLDNVDPVQAIAQGKDYSICGNCPHRKDPETGSRSCYVNVGQSVLSVWRAYKRGSYARLSDLTPEILNKKNIRWGSYGDPSIIPHSLFATLNEHAAGHTGYTHQWREDFAQVYKGDFMASCDGLADYMEASAHGWKCFSVTPKGSAGQGKQCPATVNASEAQCLTCKLCTGSKADIWVEAHGSGAKYVSAV
jgi:hypothetical protein